MKPAANALPAMEPSMTERAGPQPTAARRLRSVSRRLWLGLSAVWAAIVGLLPHILHHAGPLAGAALIAGVGGSLLFGLLGFIVAIPLLRRLYRRFGTRRAPAIAAALYVVAFSFSTFVIGPRISGESGAAPTGPGSPSMPASHAAHHR